jgi:hypothetical protein
MSSGLYRICGISIPGGDSDSDDVIFLELQ